MLIEAIVWQRPEVLFLASYASPEQLSYYNAAWALSSRLMLIATFLAPVLQAQVAGMRYSDEATRMQALYTHSSRWLCLIATPAFLLPAGLAPSLVRLLYGPDFEPAALTLSILLIGALVTTVSVAGSAIVYGTDRMGFALRWGAVAAATTLSLNGLLIPSFGAPGAAVANVAGQGVAIVATLALSLTPSGFCFPWGVSIRTLTAGLVAAFAAGLIEAWLGGLVGLLAAVPVGLATYVGAVLVLRVLRPADWTLVNLLVPETARRSAHFRALLIWALGPVPGDRP
jgi:O-antigen/teichoic acid export membrane protein